MIEIINEEDVKLSKELISLMDTLINIGYNKLNSTINFKDKILLENGIQNLKKKRLGLWGLLTIYISENNKELKNTDREKYIVKEDITLVDISNAYFGKPDYAHHIYIENDLTTTELEIGQEIYIPVIEKEELIARHKDVIIGDITNVLYERDGIKYE